MNQQMLLEQFGLMQEQNFSASGYALSPPPPPQTPREFGPLEHFDYSVLDTACTCKVCSEWRQTLSSYQEQQRDTSMHPRSCRCGYCRRRYASRSAYHAILNQRDLYCESSFHACAEPTLGSGFMGWLYDHVMGNRVLTRSWWENEAVETPLARWFMRYYHREVPQSTTSGIGWVISDGGRSIAA